MSFESQELYLYDVCFDKRGITRKNSGKLKIIIHKKLHEIRWTQKPKILRPRSKK